MDKKLHYLFLTVVAVLCLTNRGQICRHLGFGQAKLHNPGRFSDTLAGAVPDDYIPGINLLSDSIFAWDDSLYDFVPIRPYNPLRDEGSPFVKFTTSGGAETPIPVTWQTLTNIQYTFKYFEEINMKMYAPVFSDTLRKLDGKVVEVEGYVIPFDEAGMEIALSANPFSACFFCGRGSPASVMSLRLLKPGKKYKIDDYLKFIGRLRLNHDDPKEFYYVLEEARNR